MFHTPSASSIFVGGATLLASLIHLMLNRDDTVVVDKTRMIALDSMAYGAALVIWLIPHSHLPKPIHYLALITSGAALSWAFAILYLNFCVCRF